MTIDEIIQGMRSRSKTRVNGTRQTLIDLARLADTNNAADRARRIAEAKQRGQSNLEPLWVGVVSSFIGSGTFKRRSEEPAVRAFLADLAIAASNEKTATSGN